MSQPSGRTIRCPPSYSFVIRCSPVVCAVDAVESLILLVVSILINRSATVGLKRYMQSRFNIESNTDDGSFESLRRNVLFRLILFLFGAGPQALKLYTCQGIPWAQGWCTAYLASFVVNELIAYAASILDVWPSNDTASVESSTDAQSTYAKTYIRIVLWSSCALALGFFTQGLFKLKSKLIDDLRSPQLIGFSGLLLL